MKTKVIDIQPNSGKGITKLPVYTRLERELRADSELHLSEIIAREPDRVQNMQQNIGGINVNFANNLPTQGSLRLLLDLAKARNVQGMIEKMFRGDLVNNTEGRAALHVALRNVTYNNGVFSAKSDMFVQGTNVMPDVVSVLNKMVGFTSAIHSGQWKGYTGKPITDVVSFGIGGSDKGPRMVTRVLQPYNSGKVNVHYVAQTDAAEFHNVIKGLSPETTLFVIESKTFTTQETMFNAANRAKGWFLENGGTQKDIAKHFVAASTATELVEKFGIDLNNMFPFWDWVGGRLSVTSAIGLPVMLAIGPDHYAEFLAGHNIVDEHFRNAPLEENIPIKLGLMDFMYRNFFDMQTRTVAIYNHLGNQFPTYLQQLVEESMGRLVDAAGNQLETKSSAFIIPAEGPLDQHSFFQNRHQGSFISPFDFLVVVNNPYDTSGESQRVTIGNALGQIEALTVGEKNADPQKNFPGNRPANVFIVPELTPSAIGSLIALWEHRTYSDAYAQGINPSDQWGVQLGKKKCTAIGPELDSRTVNTDAHNPVIGNIIQTVIDMMNP